MPNGNPVMTDRLFGKLIWSDIADWWETSVPLPYFRGFGSYWPIDKRDSADALFRKGRFVLGVKRGRPTRSPPEVPQRAAWQQFLTRGNALWNEVMDLVVTEYHVQRPARIQAWKAVFGTDSLMRALPKVQTKAAMRPLIRPRVITIEVPDRNADVADIEIDFLSTWFNRMRVVIRAGRPIGFGDHVWRTVDRGRPKETLQHLTLGRLRRWDGPWEGVTRCDYFQQFMNLAEDRAAFEADPNEFDTIESTLPWGFARGDFDLKVFATNGALPTERQIERLLNFQHHGTRLGGVIIRAVYEYYTRNFETLRLEKQRKGGAYIEDRLPPLRDSDGLRELLQLDTINVFPEDKQGRIDLGFEFACSWDYKGLGIRWRAETVDGVGPIDIARPKQSGRKRRT